MGAAAGEEELLCIMVVQSLINRGTLSDRLIEGKLTTTITTINTNSDSGDGRWERWRLAGEFLRQMLVFAPARRQRSQRPTVVAEPSPPQPSTLPAAHSG